MPDSTRKKREGPNKIRNKRRVKTDTTEIQRIIRHHYKQLYTNKMDNLEKMDKFLEMYNLPKLNQEKIENMKKLIFSNETEPVKKKNQKKTSQQT